MIPGINIGEARSCDFRFLKSLLNFSDSNQLPLTIPLPPFPF